MDSEYLISSLEEISSLRASARKSIIILGGDFNVLDINWNQMMGSGLQYHTKVSKTFSDIMADTNFEQLVDFLTRKDKTLDLILTSHSSYRQMQAKIISRQ